jgi:hypothetical protein
MIGRNLVRVERGKWGGFSVSLLFQPINLTSVKWLDDAEIEFWRLKQS